MPVSPPTPSGLERVLFDGAGRGEIDAWVAGAVREALGADVTELLFRAGRIDAVYGVRVDDGRDAVLKVHRPPVDPAELAATGEVLDLLAAAGYPCPRLLAAPVARDGRVATVQSFVGGGVPAQARRPEVRRALAASLVEQVELLRRAPGVRELATRLGPGPAWTRYHRGPWPVPHDTIFDFSRTPDGWEWLDAFDREAADDVRRLRGTDEPVVAHGDFFEGNVQVAEGDGEEARVVAVVDWDLVVEPEAVVAGLCAGGLLRDGAPTPAEVAAFLDDHAAARGRAPGGRDRAEAAAAARWVLAFNARCDLAMLGTGDPDPASALGRLAADRAAYRELG